MRAARDLSHQVLMSSEPSELSDGTTISVPVEVNGHTDDWQRVIREAASAHDEGAVLVDGENVPSLAGGPTWIGPVSCRRVASRRLENVVIRSGGTLFSSVPEITRRVLNATGLVACVIELPIGSFDHTPSREAVIATERTMGAVDAALKQFETAYTALKQRVLELASTDVFAAVSLRANTLGKVGKQDQLPVPYRLQIPGDHSAWNHDRSRYGRSRWVRSDESGEDLFAATDATLEVAATVVVSEVPAGRVLRGFAKYLSEHHPNITRVIPVPEGSPSVTCKVLDARKHDTGQTWEIGAGTEGITHYSFTEWAEELNKTRSRRGSVSGYSCAMVTADGEQPAAVQLSGSQIAAMNLPVWYVTEERPNYLNSGDPACVTVYLHKRKVGPLLSAVPGALSKSDWMQKRFLSETSSWSHVELLAVSLSYSYSSMHEQISVLAAKVLDRTNGQHPKQELFAKLGEIAAAAEKVTPQQQQKFNALRRAPAAQEVFDEISALHRELVDAYPLLRHFSSYGCRSQHDSYIDYLVHTPPRPSE